MTPTPVDTNAQPMVEQVDDSNPQMRAIVASLAATLPPQVAALGDDQTALRAQVREVGVTLATAAGVPQKAAEDMIDQALDTAPAPVLDVAPPLVEAAYIEKP